MRERIRGWLTPRAAAISAGVWVVMLAGVFGRVMLSPPHKQSVVPIYLAAGQRWIAGEALYAFDPTMTDLYRNPPGVAVLFAPLALVPPIPAALLWRIGCIGVYALGIRRLLRDLLPPLSEWQRCGVWVLAAALVLPAFNNGQINLLIVGTAVCGITAAARGRWWEAAAWLAGCGWLKLYPFAVGLLACVAFPKQLPWRLAVCSGVLFALPFVCQCPTYVLDRHVEFVAETTADDRSEANLVRAPRDWTILPRNLFGTLVPRRIALVTSLCVAGAFASVVFVRSGQRGSSLFLPLGLGLIWLTLFGPRTEMNTYAILAPVVAVVAVGRLGVAPMSRWAGWAAAGCLGAAIVRAAFGGDGPFSLMELPAVGAMLLAMGVRWWVKVGEVENQRNGRDLNPRYGDTVYGISSAASSAARAPFRIANRRVKADESSPSITSYRGETG